MITVILVLFVVMAPDFRVFVPVTLFLLLLAIFLRSWTKTGTGNVQLAPVEIPKAVTHGFLLFLFRKKGFILKKEIYGGKNLPGYR